MRNIFLVILLSICLLVTGCASSPKDNSGGKTNQSTSQLQEGPDGLIRGAIKLSKTKVHENLPVEISVNFPFEPLDVSYATRLSGASALKDEYKTFNFVPSKNKPKGTLWTDTFIAPRDPKRNYLPIDKPVKFEVFVMAKPKDGSPSVGYVDDFYTVPTPVPYYSYDRKKINQPQTIRVQSGHPLHHAFLEAPDGTQKPFTRINDNLFEIEATLPDPEKGMYKVISSDDYGFSEEITLYTIGPNTKRIYFMTEYRTNSSGEYNDATIFSAPLDFKDIIKEYSIKMLSISDKYMEGYLKYSKRTKIGPGIAHLEGISKDRKWLLVRTVTGVSIDKDYMEDGRKLDSVSASYLLFYELETGKIRTIGEPHYIKYYKHAEPGDLIKEFGPYYFPVFWDDNEMILLEQTKENRFYGGSYKDPRLNDDSWQQIEVPYAKAKAVSLSMSDFTLSPTDNLKPATPWVYFADLSAGIIAYSDPFYKSTKKHSYSSAGRGDFTPCIISDLSGQAPLELDVIAANHSPAGYYPFGYNGFSPGYLDGEKVVFANIIYNEIKPKVFGEGVATMTYQKKVVAFNLKTGKGTEFKDLTHIYVNERKYDTDTPDDNKNSIEMLILGCSDPSFSGFYGFRYGYISSSDSWDPERFNQVKITNGKIEVSKGEKTMKIISNLFIR